MDDVKTKNPTLIARLAEELVDELLDRIADLNGRYGLRDGRSDGLEVEVRRRVCEAIADLDS